ncbi:MAG: hypothetical protein CL677_07570 [Bdellovibrionaceae bacterium]|nr:hypothetical protein [Pseudobdellovibrionaceae bacterium]|tara:strand:- start:131304 stop:132278 length:975 start_codon:yes stop_codon:yes gene_type:complete
MMVQCQKCGFSQPKDRFCANCGIDMDAYEPPEKTISEEVKSNRTIHFIVVLILLLIGGGLFYKQIQKGKDPRGNTSDSLFERITKRTNPEPTVVDTDNTSSENFAAEESASQLNETKGLTAATSQIVDPNSQDSTAESTTPTPPQRVQYSFALVNTAFLEQAMSRGSNQAGELNIYSLPSANNKPFISEARDSNELVELDGGRGANFDLNTPTTLAFTFTNPETQEDSGLSIEVSADAFEGDQIQWTVKVFANLVSADGNLFTLSSEDLVTSEGKSQVVIFGILPRAVFSEEDLSQFEGSPLQALGSEEFLNGDAEAVLIIEPQ